MIILFSGTGNSRLVAEELRRTLGGDIVELQGDMLRNPAQVTLTLPGFEETREGEHPCVEDVIWVFPVYSWGIPPVMERFMRAVKIRGAYQARHFMVCTCGDDVGRTHKQWRTVIGRRGWHPRAAYSVEMPNTYVLMKGFDVDSKETEARKLAAMPARVEAVVAAIRRGSDTDDVVQGAGALMKSAVIYPVFKRLCMSPRGFHTTDACTSCGLCARSCPMENIVMEDGRPKWGPDCALCLRCYHICPSHAVAYGSATAGKSQKPVYGSSRPLDN